MFKQVVKRGFCVNNKDAFHTKNYQNDHSRGLFKKFQQSDSTQILGNFQKRFHDSQFLQQNEVETRILKILYNTQFVERLDKFNFSQDLRKQLNLDSLNITVLLTSIEHEFTTVFEDRVFESVRNLQEIVTLLVRDPKIF